MGIKISTLPLPSLIPHNLSPQLTEKKPDHAIPLPFSLSSKSHVRSLLTFNMLGKAVDKRS